MPNFKDLEKSIHISFKNKALLRQAFIHRSYLNENRGKNLESNERLEFLGDAVLELATSKFLFRKLPQQPEGELTSLRSSLVKTSTLATVARDLHLGDYLKMSKGEEQSGGRDNPSLLANTVEALIGAIYLDQGLSSAQIFTRDHLFGRLKKIMELNLHRDFKSTLQEKIQAQGKNTPTYHTIKETGPDHKRKFTIEVRVENTSLGTGTGASKQIAEQNAAQRALDKLEEK